MEYVKIIMGVPGYFVFEPLVQNQTNYNAECKEAETKPCYLWSKKCEHLHGK